MAANKDVELQATAILKRRVFDMRQQLVPYRAIAEELNLSIDTVRRYYSEMRVIMVPKEDQDDIRDRDIEGYDESERVLRRAIQLMCEQIEEKKQSKGYIDSRDMRLVGELEDKLVNVRRARAQLTGINVPVKLDHNVTINDQRKEHLMEIVNELLGGGEKFLTTPDQWEAMKQE